MPRAWAGDCARAADGGLLIYVSVLSAKFRHGAEQTCSKTMRLRSYIAGLSVALALPALGMADEGPREHGQNELRRDVERGVAKPLSEILAAVRQQLPGEVVKVHAEQEGGRWMYELRILDETGRVFEVHVDAQTATIERVREK